MCLRERPRPSGPSPTRPMHLVATTISPRGRSRIAAASARSAPPFTYTSAVSNRLIPRSNALRTMEPASAEPTLPPRVVHDPSESSETLRPLWPRLRWFMVVPCVSVRSRAAEAAQPSGCVTNAPNPRDGRFRALADRAVTRRISAAMNGATAAPPSGAPPHPMSPGSRLRRIPLAAALLMPLAAAALAAALLAAPARAAEPDYSGWQDLLRRYLKVLSEKGRPWDSRFDYEQLYIDEGIWTKHRADGLATLHTQLLSVSPAEMTPGERTAWAINAYNFLVIEQMTLNLLV